MPKNPFALSRSFWRETWHCSVDIQEPLLADLPEYRSEIPRNLKSATVKITYIPKILSIFTRLVFGQNGTSNFGNSGKLGNITTWHLLAHDITHGGLCNEWMHQQRTEIVSAPWLIRGPQMHLSEVTTFTRTNWKSGGSGQRAFYRSRGKTVWKYWPKSNRKSGTNM